MEKWRYNLIHVALGSGQHTTVKNLSTESPTNRVSIPGKKKTFFFSKRSKLILEFTPPLIQRVPPQAGSSRVRFQIVPLEFFIDIILPAALWPLG